jgi:hypothetical protein
VTTGTLEEIHWEILPHPACSPDVHLFGPLKEALGVKRFRDDDEGKVFMQLWLDKKTQTFCL